MHPCDICPRWDASVYYLPKDSQIRSSQPQGMAPDTRRGGGGSGVAVALAKTHFLSLLPPTSGVTL